MNKLFSACAAVCLSALFFSCVTTQGSKVLNVKVVPEEKKTERFYSSIEVPSFPAHPALNALIQKIKNERFAEFDLDSTESHRMGSKMPHSFSMTWEAAELSDSLISIKIETYQYTGGANGINYIDVINWLPAENKQLFPADLPAYFGLKYTQEQWLNLLSRTTREILENKINKKKDASLSEFITEGTKPVADNFKNITVSGSKITVWFDKYQAAPGSEGILSATFNPKDAR